MQEYILREHVLRLLLLIYHFKIKLSILLEGGTLEIDNNLLIIIHTFS